MAKSSISLKAPILQPKNSTNELNDQDVVTYEVKIALSEKDDIMLYPGMLVQVDLDKAGEKKLILTFFKGFFGSFWASGEKIRGGIFMFLVARF